MHSWICAQHKEENKPLHEAHIQEVVSRHQNLKFCLISQIPMPRFTLHQMEPQVHSEPIIIAPEDRIDWIISGSSSPLSRRTEALAKGGTLASQPVQKSA